MPIYEYQCAACGQVMETWQKYSEAPLTTCAVCGGSLTKLISNCAFHLKGGGWYVTDYSGSHPNSATGDQGQEAGEAVSPPAAEATDAVTPAKVS